MSHSKNHPTLVLTIYMHLLTSDPPITFTYLPTYLPINLPTYRFMFCGEVLPFCEKNSKQFAKNMLQLPRI